MSCERYRDHHATTLVASRVLEAMCHVIDAHVADPGGVRVPLAGASAP